MTHEYKTVRLVRAEGPSWDQEAAGYSKQLSDVALEGWELVSTDPWPWVVFRRKADTDQKAGADDGSRGPRQEWPPATEARRMG